MGSGKGIHKITELNNFVVPPDLRCLEWSTNEIEWKFSPHDQHEDLLILLAEIGAGRNQFYWRVVDFILQDRMSWTISDAKTTTAAVLPIQTISF